MIFDHAYVWIWLPHQSEPVVAGKIVFQDNIYRFNYGQSYLNNPKAISIYQPELPLHQGIIEPGSGLNLANCLRDSGPDAWGRRVILNERFTQNDKRLIDTDLAEIDYFLLSGSDRIGALDFQRSPHAYEARKAETATLEMLMESSRMIEAGIPLPPDLQAAIQHGTSIGGARPKALLNIHDKKYIAKFSSSTDITNVIKGEYIAMRLAKLCDLNVAEVSLVQAAGKDVLLIERFDRILYEKSWYRKSIVSGLTLLGLDEMMARYASYEQLAWIIRHRFTEPKKQLKELFSRLVFNLICGNTDDYARNHAAFWDGKQLQLTPAYDICPQNRAGNEASQAMLIDKDNNLSLLRNCLNSCANYLLTEKEARIIIDCQIETVRANWDLVCEEANINLIDKTYLHTRQFLNPFIFTNYARKPG